MVATVKGSSNKSNSNRNSFINSKYQIPIAEAIEIGIASSTANTNSNSNRTTKSSNSIRPAISKASNSHTMSYYLLKKNLIKMHIGGIQMQN